MLFVREVIWKKRCWGEKKGIGKGDKRGREKDERNVREGDKRDYLRIKWTQLDIPECTYVCTKEKGRTCSDLHKQTDM